ncbi:MAG: hypothetical protein M1839_005436 [Geoglossum umbratile]|nr:MAG: hypothetical protein M1839_005436 [Geoglossum umbratile]
MGSLPTGSCSDDDVFRGRHVTSDDHSIQVVKKGGQVQIRIFSDAELNGQKPKYVQHPKSAKRAGSVPARPKDREESIPTWGFGPNVTLLKYDFVVAIDICSPSLWSTKEPPTPSARHMGITRFNTTTAIRADPIIDTIAQALQDLAYDQPILKGSAGSDEAAVGVLVLSLGALMCTLNRALLNEK